jgi:hypothetical protein
VLEDLANTLVGLGRALEVLVGLDLLADLLTLLRRDGLLASLPQLLDGLLVVSEILLASDEDDRQALAEVKNLGDPLSQGNKRVSIMTGTVRGGTRLHTFSWTLSRESGESIAKQMRIT